MNIYATRLIGAIFVSVFLGAWSVAHAGSTIKMTVDGMVCAFCAQGIEKKLRAQRETADLLISLEQKIVCVAPKDGTDIPDARLTQILNDAGYTVRSIARVDHTLAQIRAELKQKK